MNYRRCSCPVWCFGTENGKRVRGSLDTQNWGVAEERLRAREFGETPGIRVEEATERFLKDCESRSVGAAQTAKYKLTFDELKKTFKGRRLGSISTDDLARFREGWSGSNSTKRSKLGRLRAFWRFAIDRGWVDSNPAKLLKPPKEDRKQVQPFSAAEIEKIMWALDLYKDWPKGRRADLRAFVLLLRYSGLRIRDVVTFRKSNLVADRILLQTAKAQTVVSLPVPAEVVEALKAIEGVSEYYFWSGNGLPKTCVCDWQRSLTKLFKLAGVSNGHAHRFRHTLAVNLLAKGVSMENVAKILGNTLRIVEKHYATFSHVRQEALAAEVEKVWNVN
jgi:integrase/recombinase XerD